MRLTVDAGHVRVTAPVRTSDAEVERFVSRHEGWIHARLREAARIRAELDLPEALVDGATLLVRGRARALRIVATTDGAGVSEAGDAIVVRLPSWADPDAQESLAAPTLRTWLRAEARREVHHAADRYGPPHGLVPRAIRIKDQRTLWGSCTARGVVNINWRLVLAPEDVLDYVVVHELCHLAERNHGPGFWRLVGRVMPGCESPRAWLKRYGSALLHWYPEGAQAPA
jgi:predicted metal-dependent hydrolase